MSLFPQGAHFFLHVNLTAGAAVQLERQNSRTCIFYKAKPYAKTIVIKDLGEEIIDAFINDSKFKS